jgi:sugar phosphate isomerase/epimerase
VILGITTNVYAGPLKNHEIDLERIIDSAPSYSIRAVEIRDDGAALDETRVRSLKSRASNSGLTLSYGIKNDMLMEGDMTLFEKGARLASLCGERTVLRIVSGQEALKQEGKKGYTPAELQRLSAIAESYGQIASNVGVLAAIENARDPLYGMGESQGMAELTRSIKSKNVGLTFDPANATNKSLCKSPSTEAQVLKFIDDFGPRIFMTHYKTTSNGVVQSSIGDADTNNASLLDRLSKVYKGVLCIEIPGSATLKDTNASLEASIAYLRDKGLFKYLQ